MVDTLGDITLIALAIIYIPIIILIVRKWKAKSTRFIGLPLAILLLPVLYFVLFFHIPYYELKGFEGKVIDGETKEPIQGAAVLAVYYDEAITIAGTNTYPIDARETTTDEKGEFKIPPTREWFGERLGTVVDAKLTIFKPGYGAYRYNEVSKVANGDNTLPPPAKRIVYPLTQLKTKEERAKNILDMSVQYDLQFSKQRLIILEINEEFHSLGMLDRYVEQDGRPIRKLVR